MTYRNNYSGVDPYVVNSVRCIARNLVGKAGITYEDVEDVEQDLMLHFLSRKDQFDPERGQFNTFVNRVVKAGVKDILTHRMAQRGGQGLEVTLISLEQERDDAAMPSMVLQGMAGIDGREVDGLGHAICHLEEVGLKVDVERAIKRLPKALQEICERLGRESQKEIASEMEWSRIGLYRLILAIRETFEGMGLGAHLGTFPDFDGHFSGVFRK